MKNQPLQKGKGVGGGRRVGGEGKTFRRIRRVKRGNKRSRFLMCLGYPSDSASSSVDHSTTAGSSVAAGPSDHQNPTTYNNNPKLQQVDEFYINPERPNIRTRIRTMANYPQVLQQLGFQINQERRPILKRTPTTTPATPTTTITTPTTTTNDVQSSSGSSMSTFDDSDDYVEQRIIWDREWERFGDRPGY